MNGNQSNKISNINKSNNNNDYNNIKPFRLNVPTLCFFEKG